MPLSPLIPKQGLKFLQVKHRSALHTEEALLPVRHSPDSGDWPCFLESRAVGLLFLPLFLPPSCWGVELAWGELCAFLFLLSSGCKPEHLALGSGHEHCLRAMRLGACGLCKSMVQNLPEGETTAKGQSQGSPPPLSSNPFPPVYNPRPPSPLLPGHSLCRSGIFCRASGASSLPFTHLATMGLCYGLKERGTDMCCSQVDRRAPSQPGP